MFAGRKRRPRSDGRHTPSLPGLLKTTVLAMVLFTVVISVVLTTLGWLSGVDLLPVSPGMFSSTQLSDLVRAAVSIGTLAGGTFAGVYAYRKQRIDEAASHRADAEQLSKRYQDAAAQLGHERPAVRLAGVYAIARLADDWPENRQMCVDVLCAYLRMPFSPGIDTDDESVVRSTVFEVIRSHLSDPSHPNSWCDLSFDFSGGTYNRVSLPGCHFHRHVDFDDARFVGGARWPEKNDGWMNFSRCVFRNGVSFFQVTFDEAIISFDNATFENGDVHLGGTSFQNFNLFFRGTRFLGGKMYFGGTVFKQNRTRQQLGHVWFDDATFDGIELVFNGVSVEGFVDLRFADVEIRAGKLDVAGISLVEWVGEERYPKVSFSPSFVADQVATFPAEKPPRLTVEMPVGGPHEDRPPTETA